VAAFLSVAAAGAGALGRLPRARPEPRLFPKEGAAAGGALIVSVEATVGSPDVVSSDMLFLFVKALAQKGGSARFM